MEAFSSPLITKHEARRSMEIQLVTTRSWPYCPEVLWAIRSSQIQLADCKYSCGGVGIIICLYNMSHKQWGNRGMTIFLTHISFKNKFYIKRKLSIKNRKFKSTIRKYGRMFNKIWLKKAFSIKAQTHRLYKRLL